MLCVGITYAQKERTLKLNKEKDLIEVVYYHDNGEISQKGYYTKEGKLHGYWYSYDKKGNKLVAASYNNGNKVGRWVYWIDDKMKVVDYTKNQITAIYQ